MKKYYISLTIILLSITAIFSVSFAFGDDLLVDQIKEIDGNRVVDFKKVDNKHFPH